MKKSNSMEHIEQPRAAGPRHSILDLAPLELECLSVLWPLGEGTVRDIHRALAASRPRAYTTVMTIMDRLEQKGIVARRKVGRAFLYEPKLSAEEARLKADFLMALRKPSWPTFLIEIVEICLLRSLHQRRPGLMFQPLP
jgi:predicted transcriptional regulator